MKKLFKILFLVLFFCIAFLTTGSAQAKSFTRTINWGEWLAPNQYSYLVSAEGGNEGFWAKPGIYTINYQSKVMTLNTGGAEVSEVIDGANIPVGTRLRFKPIPLTNTDTSWNATGAAWDTPFGFFVPNAYFPSGLTYEQFKAMFTTIPCDPIWCGYASMEGWAALTWLIHPITASVDTTGTTAGMTCAPNGANTDCVVNSAGGGAIKVNFTFSATYSKHFGASDNDGYGFPVGEIVETGTSGEPLHVGETATADNPFVLNIPAAQIIYNLNVAVPNGPPILTANGPTSGFKDASQTFTAIADDPNGDPVKYGFDWNNTGSPQEWIPATGTTPENILQTVSHTWTTTGSKTINIRALDSLGNLSNIVTKTINITAAPAAVQSKKVEVTVTWMEGTQQKTVKLYDVLRSVVN